MKEQQVGYDLDLARMEINALVVLAVECGFKLAEDELIVRLRERTNHQIAVMAGKFGWKAEDVEDAQQEAYSWMKEAVRTYDTNEIGKPGGCSIETFAHQVIERRFLDFAKHVGRVEDHYDHSTAAAEILDGSSDNVHGCSSADARTKSDPETVAERHEFQAALNIVLGELDDMARRICELHIIGGMSLHAVADELAMSYDSVRHRWQAAAALMRVRLEKFA